jgi:hypothetical protein
VKLNQIIALVSGKKSRTESAVTQVYHKLQKPDFFGGFDKTYQSRDENGVQYPGESKRLQWRAEDLLKEAVGSWSSLFDAVATLDKSNCTAVADVKVGETVVLTEVPATHLLFLEKQLVNIRTALQALPVLDPTKEWKYSEETACYKSQPIQRTKTKKIPKFTVAYEATKEHPAQIDKDHEDVVEGFWTTVEFAGAVSETRRTALLARVDQLVEAVKCAREQANMTEITTLETGKPIFDFLLGDTQ